MADLVIKPTATSGNKLILKDQAGGAVLTTADSGADYVGTTKGTIDSTAIFPAGMIKKVTHKMGNPTAVNTNSTSIVSTGAGTDEITFTSGATLIITVNARFAIHEVGSGTPNVRWGSWGLMQHTSIPANGASASGTQLLHRAEGRILHEQSSSLADDYSTISGVAVDTPSGTSTFYYLGFFSDNARCQVNLAASALTWTVMEVHQ